MNIFAKEPVYQGDRRAITGSAHNHRSDYRHTIRYKGESLGLISLWYTGSAGNWKKLKRYNQIKSNASLHLGQVVRIPRALLVKQRRMPKRFVQGAQGRRPAPKPEPAKPRQKPKQAPQPDSRLEAAPLR